MSGWKTEAYRREEAGNASGVESLGASMGGRGWVEGLQLLL